jgi:hypothetical protein
MMRRILALAMAGLLGLTSVAIAQTNYPNGQPVNSQGQIVNDQSTPDGLSALGQATPADQQQPPPGGDYTPYIVGGLVIGGAGLAIYFATQNKSSSPASP